jgi:hypothetical protein
VKKHAVLLFMLVLLGTGTVAALDDPPRKERSVSGLRGTLGAQKTKDLAKLPNGFTPEREAAAMEFVRRHHPELALLLENLKKTNAREHQRAVGALFWASERLADIQQRNPELYERELREWKLSSRIQLLVAQIKITSDDEALRRVLRQALLDQWELRSARLAEERNKLADRLEKLNQRILELKREQGTLVERQMEVLLRDKKKQHAQQKNDRAKTPGAARPQTGPPIP